MAYENIVVETKGNVGLITLNRPEALNALSSPLMLELTEALDVFEANDSIGAMVLKRHSLLARTSRKCRIKLGVKPTGRTLSLPVGND